MPACDSWRSRSRRNGCFDSPSHPDSCPLPRRMDERTDTFSRSNHPQSPRVLPGNKHYHYHYHQLSLQSRSLLSQNFIIIIISNHPQSPGPTLSRQYSSFADPWSMIHDPWSMTHDPWSIIDDPWSMIHVCSPDCCSCCRRRPVQCHSRSQCHSPPPPLRTSSTQNNYTSQ